MSCYYSVWLFLALQLVLYIWRIFLQNCLHSLWDISQCGFRLRRVTFAHISLNIAFSLPPARLHVGGAGGTVARRPSRLLHLHTAPQNYQLDKIIHHTNKQWTQIGCLQCPNTFTTTCFPDLALCAKLLLGRHCCASLTSFDFFHPFSSIAIVCMYAVIITVMVG